ncbi:MAG: sensor histidine kinase [Chitinophagaceae bacterium]
MFQIKAYNVVIHIAAWLLFLSLPLLFMAGQNGGEHLVAIVSTPYYWGFAFCFIFLFYFHTYLLVPKLFLEKKFFLYFLVLLVLLLLVCYIKPFDLLFSHAPRPGSNMPPVEFGDDLDFPGPGPGVNPPRMERNHLDIISIFLFMMVVALGLALEITQRWRITEQRVARAEADKANAELSFLKAQINPHFLFNTLNNIYSMAITKNENTADSIMKLSNIMRYVTDDITEDYVSLQSEIDCITDYVDLQRLRLGRKVTLEFEVTGELENKVIAPLILMTFIENVFKYGLSNHEQSVITIRIDAAQKTITFFSRNKIFPQVKRIERSGIGIGNTKKRLEHLYPNRHFLDINTSDGFFTVQLTLQG